MNYVEKNKKNLNLNLNNKTENDNGSSNYLSRYIKIPKESIPNYNEQKNELLLNDQKIYRNTKLKKIINPNNNCNNDTQTTQSATNSTKNQNSSKNTIFPNFKDDLNNYEMNLFSAGSTTNNNIVIPILTKKRPVTHFNSGVNTIQNTSENENESKNIKNELMNYRISQNHRNKVCKSQDSSKGKYNISLKKKNVYKILPEVQNLLPNSFHKIKIEKGMINGNKLLNSYSKKISYDYKSKNIVSFYDEN